MRASYPYPLVEFLRSEIVLLHEDCCYNHEMMISPGHFGELCGDSYREIAQLEQDRYFPNIDHRLQPLCTFADVHRFMTRLHTQLGNPEGTFPRL